MVAEARELRETVKNLTEKQKLEEIVIAHDDFTLTKLQCYKRATHEVTHCYDRVTHEVT
jgi:hypothetical protein